MTLNLRDDVKYYSGRTLTSKDVEYALTTYASAASGSQLQPAAAAIDSVDTSQPEDVWDVNHYLGANLRNQTLANQNLRQALAYSLDRDRILKDVFGGVGSVNSSPWSPASPAYNKEHATRYSLDLERAKTLLAQAGGAAPFKPKNNLSGYTSDDYTQLVSNVWNRPDPTSAQAHSAYDAHTKEVNDQQFVINMVTTTVNNVYTSSVRGVDWNTHKYLILDKATVK